MKITFDLPPALVKQVKLQAVHEGKKLKETVANLLLRGMAASGDAGATAGLSKPSRSSLPVVKCSHAARPELAMTPDALPRFWTVRKSNGMVLADSNFWLAMALDKHEWHLAAHLDGRAARDAVGSFLSGHAAVVRAVADDGRGARAVRQAPLSNKAAWSLYEAFRSDERIGWVDEPPGLETLWKRLAAVKTASPKLWMDAYLAALAVAGNYRLVTNDKAFKRFKGLDVQVLANEQADAT